MDLSPPTEEAGKVVSIERFLPPGQHAEWGIAPRLESPGSPSLTWTTSKLEMIRSGWLRALPATGFGVVFGLPQKRQVVPALGCPVPRRNGRSWAGRSVQQGAVIYITGEGVSGFKRRLVAMRRHHGVEGKQGRPVWCHYGCPRLRPQDRRRSRTGRNDPALAGLPRQPAACCRGTRYTRARHEGSRREHGKGHDNLCR